MTKQEQFLWIVQTVFPVEVANIHQLGLSKDYRADISGTGAFITMDDAIWASGRIPERYQRLRRPTSFVLTYFAGGGSLKKGPRVGS
jgi:hypothetical protein